MAFVTVRDGAMSWEKGEAARPRPKKEVGLTVSSIYAWKTKTLFLQKSDS